MRRAGRWALSLAAASRSAHPDCWLHAADSTPQAISEYSADAMRWALADAGDGMDDANFETTTANAAILRMTKELAWSEEVLSTSAGVCMWGGGAQLIVLQGGGGVCECLEIWTDLLEVWRGQRTRCRRRPEQADVAL